MSSSKRASLSRWRPKVFTMTWPVKVSSTCAFTAPVLPHWAMNRGRAAPAMRFMPQIDTGTVTSATAVSTGEIHSIMPSTPTSISTFTRICAVVCWRLWATLSMSLVTRLSRSPRDWAST